MSPHVSYSSCAGLTGPRLPDIHALGAQAAAVQCTLQALPEWVLAAATSQTTRWAFAEALARLPCLFYHP